MIVDACTTTTLAATKGSKHKALPNGNALLENGMGGVNRLVRVNDQQMSPESTTAATNGHSHHPHHHHQRYHYHQEALENVMPLSNNNHLHSVQNNNSQRYFNGQNGQQQLENGLKKDSQNGFHNGQSSSPQQPTGCLKATLLDNKSMTSNGQIVARGHSLATTMRTKWPVDNGHDEVTDSNELNGTEQHSMTPTSMRRIRNRSESSPAKEECKSNGTTRGNLQDSKSEDVSVVFCRARFDLILPFFLLFKILALFKTLPGGYENLYKWTGNKWRRIDAEQESDGDAA